jgi:hypothetical protein
MRSASRSANGNELTLARERQAKQKLRIFVVMGQRKNVNHQGHEGTRRKSLATGILRDLLTTT